MKHTLLAYIGTLIFLYLMYKFGWQLADWLNNLAVNLGINIGAQL